MNLKKALSIVVFLLMVTLMLSILSAYLYILYICAQQEYPNNIYGLFFFVGMALAVCGFYTISFGMLGGDE